MEVVVKKVLMLSIGVAAFGVASQLQPKAASNWRSEEWAKQALPVQVGNYRTEPSPEDPTISSKPSQNEYDILKPFGIICRVFNDGEHRYDSSVVVGNNRDSFHDPNYCMVGQNWEIISERISSLHTKTRGEIPVSIMSGEDREGKRVVVFCYLGPHGFHPTQNTLYADWFWTELGRGKPIMGAFYRFMTTTEKDSEDDLLRFVADYLDESKITSKGEL